MADEFPNKANIRHCILYEFKRKNNAIILTENISATCEGKALSVGSKTTPKK